MHTYLSWVVYIPKLINVAPILWAHHVAPKFYKISKVKVIAPRSKVTGADWHVPGHLPFMGSPHTQNGYCSINMLDTVHATKIVYGQTD